MAAAHDVALTVHPISVRHDDFAGDRYICIGEADPVKLNLQISLADKMAGLLNRFEVALQVATSGEDRSPKLLKTLRLHKTGSPTSAVAEEKFGSSSVQWRSVPAGTTT
jgi:hypothetical protein